MALVDSTTCKQQNTWDVIYPASAPRGTTLRVACLLLIDDHYDYNIAVMAMV
jgi:hypothetical protein